MNLSDLYLDIFWRQSIFFFTVFFTKLQNCVKGYWCCKVHLIWVTDLQCCTISLLENKKKMHWKSNRRDSLLLLSVRTTRGGKKKCNTYFETLVPCYTMSKHSYSFTLVNLVILLPYGSENVLKCYKYHFLVKDTQIIHKDAKLKWHCHT